MFKFLLITLALVGLIGVGLSQTYAFANLMPPSGGIAGSTDTQSNSAPSSTESTNPSGESNGGGTTTAPMYQGYPSNYGSDHPTRSHIFEGQAPSFWNPHKHRHFWEEPQFAGQYVPYRHHHGHSNGGDSAAEVGNSGGSYQSNTH